MDGLDDIPWKNLKHAYGSAEDVPDLLRALKTASPELRGEDSPLWHLFGNIYHQGTVYEATPYAVAFLIELVADPHTPDRIGILQLLADIASARSEWNNQPSSAPAEPGDVQYRTCSEKSHDAVAAGFDTLVEITRENTDVRLAAAHVLAQFPERADTVGNRLREMLDSESSSLNRAGLLFLLGQVGDRSEENQSTLALAIANSSETERRAAALSLARLRPTSLATGDREAMLDALLAEDLEACLETLPWDTGGELDSARFSGILKYLDTHALAEAADRVIRSIETGDEAQVGVCVLLEVLFPPPKARRTPLVRAEQLSAQQLRAIRAMTRAMEGGKRVYFGHFPMFGLPDSMREWRALAAGCNPTPIDMTLPILATPAQPRGSVRPGRLVIGDRVIHRNFGLGTVTRIEVKGDWTDLSVDFDDEGPKELGLPSDGSSPDA